MKSDKLTRRSKTTFDWRQVIVQVDDSRKPTNKQKPVSLAKLWDTMSI